MQPQNFVTEQRAAVNALVAAIKNLDLLRDQWDKLDLLNTITQDDLQGDNADLTPAMLADVWTTHTTLNAALSAGDWTNLYRLEP